MTESVFPYYCVNCHNPCGRQHHAPSSYFDRETLGVCLFAVIFSRNYVVPQKSAWHELPIASARRHHHQQSEDWLPRLISARSSGRTAAGGKVLRRSRTTPKRRAWDKTTSAVPDVSVSQAILEQACLSSLVFRATHVFASARRRMYFVAVEADTSSANHPRFTIKYLSAPVMVSRVRRTLAESVRYYAGASPSPQ